MGKGGLRCEQTPLESPDYCAEILATLPQSLLVLDAELQVVCANRAYCETFEVTSEELAGSFFYELGNGQWNIPQLLSNYPKTGLVG